MSRDTLSPSRIRPSRFATAAVVALTLVMLNSCKAESALSNDGKSGGSRDSTSTGNHNVATQSLSFIHGVRVYVSAVNCEMNAEDAARINALAETPGLAVEVVFAGITGSDSSIVRRAQRDLELRVPVRSLEKGEIEQYKTIGGAQLPMALIVKGRQLKTIVSGEAMPRTLSIVEASLTSTAALTHNQSPEG